MTKFKSRPSDGADIARRLPPACRPLKSRARPPENEREGELLMDSAPANRVATGAPTGLPPTSTITLVINGKPLKLDVAPWTTLLDALREYAGLTGTKKGCDHGQCGA